VKPADSFRGVTKRICTGVSVCCGVRRFADADTIQDDENDFAGRTQLRVDFLFIAFTHLNERTIESMRSVSVFTEWMYAVGTFNAPHFEHFVPFSAPAFFTFSAKSCCFAIVSSN
jgi:hypothetical protein